VAYQAEGELRYSKLQVYGLVTTLTNRRVFEFDDEIAMDFLAGGAPLQGTHTYQRKLPLRPGRFKLDLIVKDAVSEKMGSLAIGLEVPSCEPEKLSTSSIILSQAIEPAEPDLSQPYIFGSYKVKPRVDRVFSEGDSLAFYAEAYNFLLDQSTAKPVLNIKYGFAEPGQVPASLRNINRGVTLAGDRIYLARVLQLGNINKGKHDLVLSITDTLSGQTATSRVPFEVR